MPFTPARPPLRFVAPPQWPAPAADWVIRNQGWQPPVGWVPPTAQPLGLQPAPQGWRFWEPNGAAWDEFRQPYAKHAHRAILVGGIMMAIAVAITLAGLLGEFGRSYYFLYGTLIFGAIRLVTGFAALRKVDPAARAAITADTIEVRRQLDSEAYRRYLDATARERAETGAAAMTFDEFGFARDAEPWGGPAHPAALPFGAAQPAGAPIIDAGRRSRRGLWVGLGAAAAVLVGIAIPLAIPHGSASSALSSSALSSLSGHSYDLTDSDWTLTKSGSCSSSAGCWQIDITPRSSCSTASITWDFAATKTGNVGATRTTMVALTTGTTAHVTIPVDSQLEPLQYIGLDGATC